MDNYEKRQIKITIFYSIRLINPFINPDKPEMNRELLSYVYTLRRSVAYTKVSRPTIPTSGFMEIWVEQNCIYVYIGLTLKSYGSVVVVYI